MGLINLSPIGRFHRTAGYVTSRLTNQRVIKNEKQPFCLHLQLSQISCKIETSKSMFYELAYWPALGQAARVPWDSLSLTMATGIVCATLNTNREQCGCCDRLDSAEPWSSHTMSSRVRVRVPLHRLWHSYHAQSCGLPHSGRSDRMHAGCCDSQHGGQAPVSAFLSTKQKPMMSGTIQQQQEHSGSNKLH